MGTAVAVIGYFVLLDFFETPESGDARLLHAPYPLYALGAGMLMTVIILASAWCTRDRIPLLGLPDAQSASEGFLDSLVRSSKSLLSSAPSAMWGTW